MPIARERTAFVQSVLLALLAHAQDERWKLNGRDLDGAALSIRVKNGEARIIVRFPDEMVTEVTVSSHDDH